MKYSPEPRWEIKGETPKDTITEDIDVILKHGQSGRPRMDAFKGVFRPEEIATDTQRVKRLKEEQERALNRLDPDERKREEETKKRADALEVLLDYQTEQNDWLGKRAHLVRTTEYDDRVNGVDMVAEFDTEESPERMALALDASMSRTFSTVAGNVERNVAKVMGKLPAEVKYFESRVDGRKDRLTNVIPVVVGVEGKNADPLLVSFAEIIALRQKKDKTPADHARLKAKIEAMRTHPVQAVLLEEIETQLTLYAGLLENATARRGGPPRDARAKVQKLQSLIHDIMDTKKEISLGEWREDGVLGTIREVAKTTLTL